MPIAISFLKPYQKARILTFLNPDRDPLGAGWLSNHSVKNSYWVRRFIWQGFFEWITKLPDYLPEKHTDLYSRYFLKNLDFLGL